MRIELPVANGLRTDHPVPNLPFVDDSHLPIHDGEAIEAHGRHDYNGGWGRHDYDPSDRRRWSAFTNDQFNLAYSWLVRQDPGYGRSVLLYASNVTIMHEVSPRAGDPLVFRAGGYWWDGKTWHRPSVVFDRATEEDVAVPVPDAASITAEAYLNSHPGDSDKGQVADVTTFSPSNARDGQWAHDLAYWATCRPEDGLPLGQCIVDVAAPELAFDALLSRSAAARELGLSRAEINAAMKAHGGGRAERFPLPQRHTPHTGSPRWSLPVLRDWAWERQRANPEPVVADLHRDIEHPDVEALLYTISSAAMWQLQSTYKAGDLHAALGLPLERMIGWIVTEKPGLAEALFGDIVRSARDHLNIPDEVLKRTLRAAVHWGTPNDYPQGNDEDVSEALDEFLKRTLPPSLG